MPNKDKEENKRKVLENYYKNRDRKIAYQREYDKNNKDKKREQDAKRYRTSKYNFIQGIRNYSNQHHRPILLEKYKCCQKCFGTERLQIHHLKYTNDIQDCLLLCENCHKHIHRISLNIN